MGASSPNAVDAPSLSYSRQAERWELIDDLCGGTRAMQDAGVKWLPREDKETHTEYKARLNRSILYAALSETIDTAVSRPFAKPPSFQAVETLDPRLEMLQDDADRSGTSLADLARELFTDGLKYGRFHFLVDYPSVPRGATIKDEKDAGARPYFVRVCPKDLIGWSSERGSDGQERLTSVRIRETVLEPDGEFGEKEVEQIRYITESSWTVYRKADNAKEFAPVESGPLTLGRVPMVTVYFKRKGVMESEPPYEALAWLNLKHWRLDSDLSNLMRVAMVPILVGTGLGAQEMDEPVVIGATNVMRSTRPDANWRFVEHSGAAIGSGMEAKAKLEDEMESVGLAPLTSRSGAVTATAKAIDESKSSSDLEAWTRVTEQGLWQGYEVAAEWIGAELSEDFSIDLYSDFGLSLRSAEDATVLMGLHTSHAITTETLLTEFKRRGVLGQMVDPAEEAQAARDENPMPDMTALFGNAPPPPGAGDDDGEDGDADPDEEGSGSGVAA